jgi:hypothetical protein
MIIWALPSVKTLGQALRYIFFPAKALQKGAAAILDAAFTEPEFMCKFHTRFYPAALVSACRTIRCRYQNKCGITKSRTSVKSFQNCV